MRSKQKWDEKAIDDVFENVLDSVGWILDQLMLTGCRRLFLRHAALNKFIEILETVESELLLQWKLKQESGLDRLFVRQREWLNDCLRSESSLLTTWYEFRKLLWHHGNQQDPPLGDTPWKGLLLNLLSDYDLLGEFFPVKEDKTTTESLDPIIDLFKTLYDLSPHHLVTQFFNLIELGSKSRPDLPPIGVYSLSPSDQSFPSIVQEHFADIVTKNSWDGVAEQLKAFWQNNTGGKFSLFPAFVIKKGRQGGFNICGVQVDRSKTFDNLIGIDRNRELLIENTQQFLQGKFAHHALLWGGRGTGKSSCVLALVNMLANQGLRLIEVQPQEMGLIPHLSETLKRKPEKFILFCDDLSFEKDNSEFKHLKSVLEGSVINPAKNILLIATSNRKDLVLRGDLDEWNPEQKQVIDEKRAIDDRFGLKLFFDVPVFKDLEKILYGCADRENLEYNKKDLFLEFRQFAQKNNHDKPSGRTVMQFINQRTR